VNNWYGVAMKCMPSRQPSNARYLCSRSRHVGVCPRWPASQVVIVQQAGAQQKASAREATALERL
jgi:hypothetical protein